MTPLFLLFYSCSHMAIRSESRPAPTGMAVVQCRGELLVERTELSVGRALDSGMPVQEARFERCMLIAPGEAREYPLTCLSPTELSEAATRVSQSQPGVIEYNGKTFGALSIPNLEESLCIQQAAIRANTRTDSAIPNLNWEHEGVQLQLNRWLVPIEANCTDSQLLCHVFGNVGELVGSTNTGYASAGGDWLTAQQFDEPIRPQLTIIDYVDRSSDSASRSALYGIRLVRRQLYVETPLRGEPIGQ